VLKFQAQINLAVHRLLCRSPNPKAKVLTPKWLPQTSRQPPFGLPASIPTAGQGIKIPNSIFNPKICNAIFISVRIYCKCSGSLLAKVIHAFEVLIPNFKNFSAACSIPFQMWDFEFGQPLGFRFKPTDFLGYLFLFKTISMRSAIFWLPAEWPSNHFFKAVFVWSCTVFFCTF
jgi:hypothetical protein